MRKLSSLLVVLGAAWMAGAAVVAQGPPAQAPMQLKVLPDTWSRQQVGALMNTFNTSLGVQCSFCHAEDPNAPPPAPGQNPRLDYALDTEHKEVARAMIKMTMDLNALARQHTGEPETVEKVSCFTCHRGAEAPAFAPAEGWGRGSFALHSAGPTVPQRGRGPAAPPPSN